MLRTLSIATCIRNPSFWTTCSFWWCANCPSMLTCKHVACSFTRLYFYSKIAIFFYLYVVFNNGISFEFDSALKLYHSIVFIWYQGGVI